MHASPNGLLAQLAMADQAVLLRKATLIQLDPGVLLSPTQHTSPPCIYFPVSGSIALCAENESTPSAAGLAMGLIGTEGAVGLQAALGFGMGKFQLWVQSAGQAYVVHGQDAQHLAQRKQQVLLHFSRYLWSVYEQIATMASQAYTQDIQMRLAHWLLLSAQRCAPDPLFLTHAHIAKMLGVRRASISIAAHDMKCRHYISYNRGRIQLLNVPALAALAKNKLN